MDLRIDIGGCSVIRTTLSFLDNKCIYTHQLK